MFSFLGGVSEGNTFLSGQSGESLITTSTTTTTTTNAPTTSTTTTTTTL
jgi:hypothetical protein